MTAPARPLIPTAIVTEYGEFKGDPASLADAGSALRDPTHVPGWSDMRRDADMARSEGRKPAPLPVGLHWFRRTKRDGSPTNERTVVGHNAGYRAVRFEEIGKVDWIKEMPGGAFKLPDGTIGNADMQLMVIDQDRAIRRAASKTLHWLERATGSADEAFQQAAAKAPGSHPEVTRELGPARTK